MATKTFLNLPEEKRERILEAAWAEFDTVSFAEASINRIVRRAGVPRGSFYQYFRDKEELFRDLIHEVQEKFSQWMLQCLQSCGGDLFEAQRMTFARVVYREKGADPTIDRCIQVLRLNRGIDLQRVAEGPPNAPPLLRQVLERVDLTGFRSREEDFLCSVYKLTMMAMGAAVMEALACPEKTEACAAGLAKQLEIIRCGAVESAGAEQEGAKP